MSDQTAPSPSLDLLQDTSFPDGPPAASDPDAARGMRRPYVNDALNSRSPHTLPAPRAWEVAVNAALDTPMPYHFVLHARDRIWLQGRGMWSLHTAEGTRLAQGGQGWSDLVLDPEAGRAYQIDAYGWVRARALETGESLFYTYLEDTQDSWFTYLALHEATVLAAHYKPEVNPHPATPPLPLSYAEAFSLGEPEQYDEDLLLSGGQVRLHTFEVPTIYAALQGDTFVMAIENRLIFADTALQIEREYGDGEAFTPLALSLDEQARAYLIVQTPEGPALWIVTPDGRRLLNQPLPDEPPEAGFRPPLIRYDHTAVLLLSDGLLFVPPRGEEPRRVRLGSPVAGAIVGADDRLLVAAGRQLLGIGDPSAQFELVHTLETSRWTSAPTLTAEGHILITTEQTLMRITPERR